jgi:hypothetical protein
VTKITVGQLKQFIESFDDNTELKFNHKEVELKLACVYLDGSDMWFNTCTPEEWQANYEHLQEAVKKRGRINDAKD